MKNYTTIQNNITSKLDSADTYRFTCLSFTPRKDGYTDSTFKQLGEYINRNKPESENTIKDFIKRLKQSKIIKIDEVSIEGKRRNKYFIPAHIANFRIVKKELLELDLPVKHKGFMIQLFSLAINNSFDCNFSLNKIVTLIKVSKPTAQKYLAELVEKNHIIKTDSGYRLSSNYFSIGKSKYQKLKEQQIAEIYKTYGSSHYFKTILDKTDWNIIKFPELYIQSIEGGYIGKKSNNSIENTVIEL